MLNLIKSASLDKTKKPAIVRALAKLLIVLDAYQNVQKDKIANKADSISDKVKQIESAKGTDQIAH